MPSLRRSRRPLLGLLLLGAVIALIAGGTALGHASRFAARATSVTAPAVTSPLIVGLSEGASGFGGGSTAPRLRQIVSITHTKWMRDPFWWYAIEPRPGHFRFGYYDHYMLQIARRGLHVVAQLMGSPGWAGASTFAIPANPKAYAAYVAAVIGRYGVGGTFWRKHPSLRGSAITAVEIWNEPYFDNGNAGRYDPARYARLIRAAWIAGHHADRSIKILMEAEMEPHHYNVWRWWVDSLYRAMPSLNRYFDGVSNHDFGYDVTHLSPIRTGSAYPNFGRVLRIEDLRRQFVRHHAAKKPFWIMEMGWSTCRERTPYCVTAAQQRTNLITMNRYLHTRWRSWVQAAFVYKFDDGTQPATVQGGYGLVYGDDSPKPALSVFRSMADASAG